MQNKERTYTQANDHVKKYEVEVIAKLEKAVYTLAKLLVQAEHKAKKCGCASCEKAVLAAKERLYEKALELEIERQRQTAPPSNIQTYDDRQ
jgi:hypothetical protein